MMLQPFGMAPGAFETRVYPDEYPDQLAIDVSHMRFVKPHGMVGIAVAIDHAHQMQHPVDLRCDGSESEPVRYLSRMMSGWLSSRWVGNDLPDVGHRSARQRFLELQEFAGDLAECTRVAALVRNWVAASTATGVSGDVWEALSEIAENVIYHAGAARGYAAAQVFQRDTPAQCISFAIGDAGIGARTALEQGGHVVPSDVEAIRMAMDWHVTSMPDHDRGLGIPSTIELIRGLGGSYALRSGSAMVKESTGGRRSFQACHWQPGVLFSATVPCPPQTTEGW